MDTQTWRRARPIFEKAAALPASDRAAFIGRVCAGDILLESAVMSLLAYDESAESGFQPALNDLRAIAEEEQVVRRLGQRMGPYRLTRRIGRGGMGEVYLGERDDGRFQREVAVKLLHAEMHGKRFLRRFRAERQILANLDHPNIASLIDGGTSAEGEPFLVMEYIDGVPILQYCDERRLSISQRLKLFRQVCGAVQHAHRNLIIHRDIKSKNILVDGEGIPHLLDFGIAKLLGPVTGLTATEETQTGVRVLTPYNASPEQLRGEQISTSTDIYALGLLLYEMLCGLRAHEGDDPRKLMEAILSVEPPPPSFRLALSQRNSAAGVGNLVAARSGSSIRQLRHQIAGDPDAIVMRALAKKPEHRYPSVESLLGDLWRHRNGLPIKARPADTWYRTRKWLRRHRWATAFAATFLLAVLAGVAMTFYHIAKVRQERNHALGEKRKAQEITRVLLDSFELHDPSINLEGALDSAGLLDGITTRVNAALKNQPGLKAILLNTIGGAYIHLGHYQVAEPLLDRALALNRGQQPAEAITAAAIQTNFGSLHMGLGHYAEARQHFARALVIYRENRPAEDIPILKGLRNLASAHYRMGKYQQARTLLLEAHDRGLALPQEQIWYHAQVLNDLGLLLSDLGENQEAEEMLHHALTIYRDVFGEDNNSEIAVSLNNLATLYQSMNNMATAEEAYTKAWKTQRQVLGEEHPLTLQYLGNLALVILQRGRLSDAETLFSRLLALQNEVFGPKHPEVARTLNNLSLLYLHRKDLRRAIPLLRRCLQLKRDKADAEQDLSPTLSNLGFAHILLGELETAEPMLREALAIDRCYLGEGHPFTALTMVYLAEVRARKGHYAEGEALALAALNIFQQQEPVNRWRLAFVQHVYGLCVAGFRRFEEAEEHMQASLLQIFVEKGQDSIFAEAALQRMVMLYEAWGKTDEATRYREGLSNN